MADHDATAAATPDHQAGTPAAPRFGDAISGQLAAPRVLLVWDAPNMDMGLGEIGRAHV